MRVSVDDYIILQFEKKKTLAKVTSKNNAVFTAVVNGNSMSREDTKSYFEFTEDEILANLGKDPQIGGSVYGVKVEPWKGTLTLPGWVEINLYRDIEYDDKKIILKTFNYVRKILEKHNLDYKINDVLNIEFKYQISRFAGYYTYSGRDNKLDTLVLCPAYFDDNLPYYLMHELGHHVWHRFFNDLDRSRWVKIYKKSVAREKAGQNRIHYLLEELIDSKMNIKEFTKKVKSEESDLELWKEILSYIRKNFKLASRHLDLIIKSNNYATVKDMWPKDTLELSTVKTLVSEYGAKNPEELFCESFSHALVPFLEINPAIEKILLSSIKDIIHE